ncbi:MAG TPA: hypothetical protein VFE61_12580 [Candidatus Sulfotelmatobacter sp.]|nr:hypothetical protein [Candidatus Sulfotelmatobacter sp.]
MIRSARHFAALFLATLLCTVVAAQESSQTSTSVPRLVTYSGRAIDEHGKTISGVAGVTFAIYKDQEGGSPLWMETQNVSPDAQGHFTVQLGSTASAGLPVELFTSGEARWLGTRMNGGEERPRVLLVSVPYALKAADAQTLGGLPASAFMLAAPISGRTTNVETAASAASAAAPPPTSGTGTTDFLPLWLNSAGTLGNSVLFQSGTGSTAKVGVNTTAPGATLDVKGTATIRGPLTLPSTANATSAAGASSQSENFIASVFNGGTHTVVNQKFRWQAEPVGNNTANASGSLNLLFAPGTGTPAETGLRIGSTGRITFASGQTFPGTATSVGLSAPSSDFTVSGSPVTGAGTLALNWTVSPSSADTANAIVKRDSSGSFSAGAISATATSSTGTAISASTSAGVALAGIASANGDGVFGQSNSAIGVYGLSKTSYGMYGSSNSFPGVQGTSESYVGVGGLSVSSVGVYGYSSNSHGVQGDAHTTGGYGVYGTNSASGGAGVLGVATVGVYGASNSANSGVYGTSAGGWGVNAYGSSGGTGILAGSDTGYAGWFNGDLNVDGNLSKAGGSFKIDHPLDPANKYLYHSFVESPDMMNIYNGNATTNAAGDAVVTLPDWFETLNQDFRYQLTVVGQFAQAIVAGKVANHKFAIKTDKPNVEVSWQITGIRHDAWANAHRIPVEEQKAEKERGTYLHPELFGAPEEKGVLWSRAPQAMKQWKEARTKLPGTGQRSNPSTPSVN